MDFTEFEPKLEYGKYYSNKYISVTLSQELKGYKPLFIFKEKQAYVYYDTYVDIPSLISFGRGESEKGVGILFNNLILEYDKFQGIILVIAPLKNITNVELMDKRYV